MNNLQIALQYLQDLLNQRLKNHFEQASENEATELPLPQFDANETSLFTQFIQNYQLSKEELVVMMLSLVPHIHSNFFDQIIATYLPDGGDFPAFGGVKGSNHRGLLPTGETAVFVLAGQDLAHRFAIQQLFGTHHFFEKHGILYLEQVKVGEPALSGRIIMDTEYIEMFTMGTISIPRMSTNFPAQYISTNLEWSDLVLNDHTLFQIQELEAWIKHNDTLMQQWGMGKRLKPGYRALLYGPPGTGKTLTATLLGKYTNRDVFRIDLSMVVSKYIGETEKNMSKLFDKAQNKNWILFFDEADALFGKRTNVRDAHDKYANQEVSYLLQRIESYPGLTILASNFKNNIDDAFLRRFNSIIYFPVPKAPERLKLWESAFPQNVQIHSEVNFQNIAQQYELTGAHIMNVVHHACLSALNNESHQITNALIKKGVVKEFAKEGRVM